jgi:transcriptional regulator with XRE-family HTH domain
MSRPMAKTSKLPWLMKGFGTRLRALRQVAGYNDAESFAAVLGINAPAYRKYERGDAWPPLDVLVQIVELTNSTMDFLLLGKK